MSSLLELANPDIFPDASYVKSTPQTLGLIVTLPLTSVVVISSEKVPTVTSKRGLDVLKVKSWS